MVAYKAEQYDRAVEEAKAYLEEIGTMIEQASESGQETLRTMSVDNPRSTAAAIVLRLLHEVGYKAHYTQSSGALIVSWADE